MITAKLSKTRWTSNGSLWAITNLTAVTFTPLKKILVEKLLRTRLIKSRPQPARDRRGGFLAGLQQNGTTLDALIDGGVEYIADFINDDQPYVMDVDGRQIYSIPYSLELNDLPQFLSCMGRTAEEFAEMIRRQFDTLYRESIDSRSGRVIAICLHPFVIGVPHRISALDDALAYINGHDGVWKATGNEIIEHFAKGGDFLTIEAFKPIWALGLMSGTSIDGIDVALIETDGEQAI